MIALRSMTLPFPAILTLGFLIAATSATRAHDVVRAAAGANYTHFIRADGTLWGVGKNLTGQLGDGTRTSRTSPVLIASGVESVDDGLDHTAFIKTDGTLWTVGTNSEGALGDGTRIERVTPVQIATNVASVSVDNGHTMFVKRDGTLWGVGTNFFGNLGDGTTTDRLVPVHVASEVASVAVGVFTTLFIKTDGTLWGTGRNHYGALGDGTTAQRNTPLQIETNVTSVSTSGLHTMFVKNDGTLWGMGHNLSGQLGDGTTTDRLLPVQVASGVTAVSAGFFHTLFVKTDGSLWAMGQDVGMFGDAAPASRHRPARVMGNVRSANGGRTHSVVVKQDGTLFGMGSNTSGELASSSLPPPYPTPLLPVQIFPAPSHTNLAVSASPGVSRFVASPTSITPAVVDGELTIAAQAMSIAAVNILLGDFSGTLNNTHEELGFVPVPATMGNISGSFEPTHMVLSLRSEDATATLGQWQNALRAITYAYTSPTPLTGHREIIFAAHNGVGASALARKSVHVTWVASNPENVAAGSGSSVDLSATINVAGAVRWRRNGADIAGATTATYTLPNFAPESVGLYALASDAAPIETDPAIVGLMTTNKVLGSGEEVGSNILHPNGNRFDQVLMTGTALSGTSESAIGRITRTSFVDLDDDIVQVEFSGPGTLSLVLDTPSGPAGPLNYHQPGVSYMKGHASIVIVGADERTSLTVFTVGRATAYDPTGAFDFLQPISGSNSPASNGSALFKGHERTSYDGVADIAFIAIASTNGRFGGLRAANAHFFASRGFTGLYAPAVVFEGPVYIGDITAFDTAKPVFRIGATQDARITGGDLFQQNGQPLQVSGLTQLRFTPGGDSHGNTLSAQPNRAVLLEDGVDRTNQIVVNP